MAERIQATVHGKVQGVFFRESTKNKAQELGLAGFVRNEPDGTVYLEVEGGHKELERFTAWLKQGPEAARVDRVDLEKGLAAQGFQGFEVQF